jgi:hypothetical protein
VIDPLPNLTGCLVGIVGLVVVAAVIHWLNRRLDTQGDAP